MGQGRQRPADGREHRVYVGDNDNYFLDNGVDRFDAAVSTLSSPPSLARPPTAQFRYGRNADHGWSPWVSRSAPMPKVPAHAHGPVDGGVTAKTPVAQGRRG